MPAPGTCPVHSPASDVDAVLAEIRDLASALGMHERVTARVVKGGLLYFTLEPTRTSFTDLGVRRIEDKIIVDLILRTAGLDATAYDELQQKLEQLLKRRYGSEVVVIMDRAQMVPRERRCITSGCTTTAKVLCTFAACEPRRYPH